MNYVTKYNLLGSIPRENERMISSKVFLVLSFIVLASYASLWVLGQFEWFKKYKDAGLTFAFEALLGLVALLTGIIGIYSSGYKEGVKEWRDREQ